MSITIQYILIGVIALAAIIYLVIKLRAPFKQKGNCSDNCGCAATELKQKAKA